MLTKDDGRPLDAKRRPSPSACGSDRRLGSVQSERANRREGLLLSVVEAVARRRGTA
jgi:hypothetical protein